MTCVIPSQSHDISSFLMPVIQCIVAQWRHISSESAVALLLHLCSICSHILIFVAKCDAQSKAWDILLVLTSVAGNLCNKCPSGYSNKTAVKVILSMRSLVSIKQQSPRRPCDTCTSLRSSTRVKWLGALVRDRRTWKYSGIPFKKVVTVHFKTMYHSYFTIK